MRRVSYHSSHIIEHKFYFIKGAPSPGIISTMSRRVLTGIILLGTLIGLGHQGNYSGDPNSPVGVNPHFLIMSENGRGNFRSELDVANSLDPSLYFCMGPNANTDRDKIPVREPGN